MGDWGIAVVGERIRCRGGSNLKGTEGCGSAGVRRELARRQSCGLFHLQFLIRCNWHSRDERNARHVSTLILPHGLGTQIKRAMMDRMRR